MLDTGHAAVAEFQSVSVKVAQNSSVTVGSLGLVSVLRDRAHHRAREDALNLRFEEIKTNMAARGLLSKSLSSLSLMKLSPNHFENTSPSVKIKRKTCF